MSPVAQTLLAIWLKMLELARTMPGSKEFGALHKEHGRIYSRASLRDQSDYHHTLAARLHAHGET